MNRAARPWQVLTPEGGGGRLKSRHPISNHQFRTPQTTGIRILKELSPGRSALPSPVPMERSTFCPSRRTPTASSTEMVVAVLSSRVLVTVLSRMRRTSSSIRQRWGPGGVAERKRWASGRSGLQWAASPSVGKKDSRLCDAYTTLSCCKGLVSCGSDGRDARRDDLLGQHLTDFVPIVPLIPHHRGRRRQVFA